MATRHYITLGASTTAGGTVTSASSPLSVDGVGAALEGDAVACPACASVGTIGLEGERLTVRANGRHYALDGDVCLCGCAPLPRLVAGQRLVLVHAQPAAIDR